MTSQIPSHPVTPEALSRLTEDERPAFIRAAQYVAEERFPPLAVVADLVLMVQRLIAAQENPAEPPLEVRPGGAVVLRPDGGDVLVIAFAPDVPPERAAEVSHNLHHASGLKVIAVADVAAVKGWQPADAALPAVLHFADTWRELMSGLPDSYTCTLTCGEANAAADLYRALGDEDTAAFLLAAHAAYDEDGDEHYREAGRG